MPCDINRQPGETIQSRAEDIRRAVKALSDRLASGRARMVIGPSGAPAFVGLPEGERRRVTDACLYRKVMTYGGAQARMAIQRAEMLAGRSVDKQALAAGHHSHDEGATWHDHKG
jgi:hypothetical protein